MTHLMPTGHRVVVKRKEHEEKTEGGLFIPDRAKGKQCEGTVIAVGPGRLLQDGTLAKVRLGYGDRVLFGEYAGGEVRIDNEEFTILSEDEVLAVIR